jgi:hypothetical protein
VINRALWVSAIASMVGRLAELEQILTSFTAATVYGRHRNAKRETVQVGRTFPSQRLWQNLALAQCRARAMLPMRRGISGTRA